MQLAVTNHPVRVDDEKGPIGDPGIVVENAEGLRDAPMRPEIGQQRMAYPAHRHAPCLQCEDRIHTQTDDLSIHLIKLRQRTVERGSLIGSATGEGEREGVHHYPLTFELFEGHVFAFMTAKRELGCIGTCF